MVEVNVTLNPVNLTVSGDEPGVTLTIGGGIGPAAVYNTALTQLVGVNPIAAGKNISITTTGGSYTIIGADPPVLSVQGRTGSVVLTLADFSAANASHTHIIGDVTGLQAALDGKQAAGSYALSTHTHTISNVSGLQTALDSKASAAHTHIIGDVTGLQSALDGKQASGSYASSTHTHAIADISGLQTSLNSKASTTHSHVISDVTGLQTALDGKQASGTYATLVNGLVPSSQLPSFVDDVLEYSTLAGFPATGETGKIFVATSTGKAYRWSGSAYVEIVPSPGSTDSVPEGSTNLYFTEARALAAVQSALDGKAATSHTHTVSAITGLQSLLDAKAAVSHTHAIADVSGLQSAINLATTLTVAPSTDTAAGSIGQLAVDANYLYACVGSNVWKRVELVSYGTAIGGIVITVQPTSTTITAGVSSSSLAFANTFGTADFLDASTAGDGAAFYTNGTNYFATSTSKPNGIYYRTSSGWSGPWMTTQGPTTGVSWNASPSMSDERIDYVYQYDGFVAVPSSAPYRHIAGNSTLTVAAKTLFRQVEQTPNVIKTSFTTGATPEQNLWSSLPLTGLGTAGGVFGCSGLAAKSNMVVASLITGSVYDNSYGGGQPVYARSHDNVPVAYTLNGSAWSGVTFSEYAAIHAITFTGGRFLAIGTSTYGNSGNPSSARAWYSTNGVSWTGVSMPSGQWFSMAVGNGKIVCVGFPGMQDGITSGFAFIPHKNYIYTNYYTTQSVVTSSDNGSTWTLRSGVLPTIETWIKVIFIGGTVNRFYAFATNNQVAAVSADGIVWDVVFLSGAYSFYGQSETDGDTAYSPSPNGSSRKITATLSSEGGSGSATFTCAATTESGTLTYRWQKSIDNGNSWSDIAGATSATLTLNDQQVSDSGSKYRCRVSNGTAITYTSAATLTVTA